MNLEIVTWKKFIGLTIIFGGEYIFSRRFFILIVLKEDQIEIKRHLYFANNHIIIDLNNLSEVIFKDMGSELYLRFLRKDRDEQMVVCTGISRKDLNDLIQKLKNKGISVDSHFGL